VIDARSSQQPVPKIRQLAETRDQRRSEAKSRLSRQSAVSSQQSAVSGQQSAQLRSSKIFVDKIEIQDQ